MAIVTIKGICSGTAQKVGRESKKPYAITRFVEFPSLRPFDVFGDLGIPASAEVREYVFECDIKEISNVVVVSGPSPASKNNPK